MPFLVTISSHQALLPLRFRPPFAAVPVTLATLRLVTGYGSLVGLTAPAAAAAVVVVLPFVELGGVKLFLLRSAARTAIESAAIDMIGLRDPDFRLRMAASIELIVLDAVELRDDRRFGSTESSLACALVASTATTEGLFESLAFEDPEADERVDMLGRGRVGRLARTRFGATGATNAGVSSFFIGSSAIGE